LSLKSTSYILQLLVDGYDSEEDIIIAIHIKKPVDISMNKSKHFAYIPSNFVSKISYIIITQIFFALFSFFFREYYLMSTQSHMLTDITKFCVGGELYHIAIKITLCLPPFLSWNTIYICIILYLSWHQWIVHAKPAMFYFDRDYFHLSAFLTTSHYPTST